MNAERSSWLGPKLTERADSGSDLVHRRAHGGIQSLAGFREVYASRGTLHERNANPFLQAPKRLAHCGMADSKSLARRSKPFGLGNGDERRQSIELVCHWKEFGPAW